MKNTDPKEDSVNCKPYPAALTYTVDDESFSCTYPGCNFSSYKSSDLIEHIREEHPLDEIECRVCKEKTRLEGEELCRLCLDLEEEPAEPGEYVDEDEEEEEEEEERTCKYCGEDISHRQKNAEICNSKECKNKRARDSYNKNKDKKPVKTSTKKKTVKEKVMTKRDKKNEIDVDIEMDETELMELLVSSFRQISPEGKQYIATRLNNELQH